MYIHDMHISIICTVISYMCMYTFQAILADGDLSACRRHRTTHTEGSSTSCSTTLLPQVWGCPPYLYMWVLAERGWSWAALLQLNSAFLKRPCSASMVARVSETCNEQTREAPLQFCTQLTKAYVAETSCSQLLQIEWICHVYVRICSRSIR